MVYADGAAATDIERLADHVALGRGDQRIDGVAHKREIARLIAVADDWGWKWSSHVAKDLRMGKVSQNDLLVRLAADARLSLKSEALDQLVAQGRANAGDAPQQVDHFAERVAKLAAEYPDAAAYQPGSIL